MNTIRYAIDGSVKISKVINYDVVVIGSGIAGLYTALNIKPEYSCCVLAKESIEISNSWLAQGGNAAAITPADRPDLHLQDTLVAGAGLCDRGAVEVLVAEGPADIRNLVEMNVPFDLNSSGELDVTREGGHHMNRIVHAGGDATGRETVKVLAFIAAKRRNISFHDNSLFVDVITDEEGSVCGALVRTHTGEYVILATNNLVIATGGIGQVYRNSTNPSVATGDGLAAAVRAGAKLKGMEFIQFHPTGLWSDETEDRAFLISEAVRGEGGLLKNKEGVRFMLGAHELNELAPRDIVARAIFNELKRSGESHAYIDITAESEEMLSKRFPTIFGECLKRGINISKDWIPICPVQHYLIGGIYTDNSGKTKVKGLYACGEAASTGVHGANRLASNSMLECLVFGRKAAEDINESLAENRFPTELTLPVLPVRRASTLDIPAMRDKLKEIMSEKCYVIRNESDMNCALEEVREMKASLEACFDDSRDYFEMLNLCITAESILVSAMARKESVGAHYRVD